MSMSIPSTQSSQNTLNALNRSTAELNNSIERLSTGRRINRSADDASGLIIGNILDGQTRGMGQMIRNLNDSISMVQISDSSLGNATGIVQGIRETALQAGSGSLTQEDRMALQSSVNDSVNALGDLYKTTTYNGQQLLLEAPGLAGLKDLDLTTPEGAQAAIQTIDTALGDILSARSQSGSLQNQLASQVSGLQDTLAATQASQSNTMDVDIAEEAMNMKKMEGLRKANLFVLAQSRTRTDAIASLLA
ncbi:MAG: flagellin [Pseudomonadota bacterium]